LWCDASFVFTRPTDVSDAAIVGAVRDGWEVDASAIEYMPVGFDSHHWRVETSARTLFVTVDDLAARRTATTEPLSQVRHRLVAALSTAQHLSQVGLGFVVAPEPTLTGAVVYELTPSYIIAVHPNVDGRTRDYGNYDTHHERVDVLNLIAALHTAPHECRSTALIDDHAIANREGLEDALRNTSTPWRTGPFAEQAQRLLSAHTCEVLAVLDRYDNLVQRVRAGPDRRVITHGEPHPANTIVTDRGVVLVDWDTTLLAPPERDLWDLIGEDDTIADLYERHTGTAIDSDAVELYRLTRDLNEIAIYIDQFRHEHVASDDTSTAWTNVQHYLNPNRW
jgi:Phosphotransferase enzyme family